MGKLVVFMHCTVDGFVAGPKGEMNWIHVDAEIFDYAGERTKNADTALYGRITYMMMESYWPTAADKPNASKHDIAHSAWYNRVEKIVASRTLHAGSKKNTTIISNNLCSEIKNIKKTAKKDILMFGSPSVVHSLLAENLIDDYWLLVNPVILGEGIPMFANVKQKINLELKESKTFSSGVVCLHYTSKDN